MNTWRIYKKVGAWDDVIEGPDANGVEVVAFDDSFAGLLGLAQLILDRHYPEAVFSSHLNADHRDPGVKLVVAMREVIRAQGTNRSNH